MILWRISRGGIFLCGDGGVSTKCSNSSDGGVVTVSTFFGGVSGLSSENPKVGPSTEEPGGGFFSLGSLGGFLSVRGRVTTESWE